MRPAHVALGILAAAVAASLFNAVVAVVAVVAHAAGASDDLQGLEPAAYVFFTVLGVLIATGAGLSCGGRLAPASTLRWLVPVVLVVTWVPDVLIGVDGSTTGVNWTGIAGLMVLHVVVAAVSVAVLARVLPVADRA